MTLRIGHSERLPALPGPAKTVRSAQPPVRDRRDGSARGWRRRRSNDNPDLCVAWLPRAQFLAQLLGSRDASPAEDPLTAQDGAQRYGEAACVLASRRERGRLV